VIRLVIGIILLLVFFRKVRLCRKSFKNPSFSKKALQQNTKGLGMS
jgi:hypothetical protein